MKGRRRKKIDLNELKRLRMLGYGDYKLARYFGCSQTTIRRRLKEVEK